MPIIKTQREAKAHAYAVIGGFIFAPVAVIMAFVLAASGATGGFFLCIILAVLICIVTARYSKHLTAYRNHEKETNV